MAAMATMAWKIQIIVHQVHIFCHSQCAEGVAVLGEALAVVNDYEGKTAKEVK
jgi:hypothetical protein